MLNEVSIAGIYLPPFLLYLVAALPVFAVMRAGLARTGVLGFAWHPALLEFAVLLATIAFLILLV